LSFSWWALIIDLLSIASSCGPTLSSRFDDVAKGMVGLEGEEENAGGMWAIGSIFLGLGYGRVILGEK